MATVPLSGTNVRLLSNVPFSNDYKNTRWFDSQTEQLNYFLAKPLVYSESQHNFQRVNGQTFISINKSIDDLWGVNYLMFQNASYNNKWFYAFVTKLEFVQVNTTYVHFQIDVFQTWKFDMNFKPSFVVREHCKLWNSDGTPVINTLDEGLNYGTEYDTVSVINHKPYDTIYFLVIIAKSAMHTEVTENKVRPTLNGLPQPLSYYVHPFKLNGESPKVVIGGTNLPISNIENVLLNMSTQDNEGNNLVSAYVTEYFGYNANYDSTSDTITFDGYTFGPASISDNVHENETTIAVNSFPDYNAVTKTFPNKYSGYDSVTESKLLMYPYTLLTMDDLKGNRINLKNEYINGNDINITVKGSLGTSNKVSYTVADYLLHSTDNYATQVSQENALINNSPNDIPILSDFLSAYLQGNRNSIENQKNSIVWNGAMGMVGNAVSGVNAGTHGSLLSSSLGVASAGVGIVQGAGNTVLQLQGIEAKLRDIENIPPSLVKMGGNVAFDYGNKISGVYLIKKQIKPEYIKKLTDFFNMFGYKVNEVKLPNFHTRQYWNYVQTQNCNITGNFNNDDLNELKSVFDNGITLWHTDDVGNYALENEVL